MTRYTASVLESREGDDVLTLGGLGNKVVTEKHSIAQSRPMCIQTTSLVNTIIDDELRGGEVKKPMIWSALKIA